MNKRAVCDQSKKDSRLLELQKYIGYCFESQNLLETAMTHPSTVENSEGHYERLEFLGDTVLGFVISEMLFNIFTDDDEGLLTKKKIALVRGQRLVEVAEAINLGSVIQMSKGEEDCGGRSSAKNLENALEALIGAIYLDGGLLAAQEFVARYWGPLINKISELQLVDPKTALQEWAQSRNLPVPVYRVVNKTGLEHCPKFTVEVQLSDYRTVSASGKNKKSAEIAAARLLLEELTQENGTKA
ncbi:ribonuclease III [Anaplasma platys]|nr:ribonuclease III [Anaplasma platys]